MVGFDANDETDRLLNGGPVDNINPDLTGLINLTVARLLPENKDISFQGPSPKAPFDIASDVAHNMIEAPVNPNGRPNSDVVRPVVSAIDLVQRSRGKWTIDFALRSHLTKQPRMKLRLSTSNTKSYQFARPGTMIIAANGGNMRPVHDLKCEHFRPKLASLLHRGFPSTGSWLGSRRRYSPMMAQ